MFKLNKTGRPEMVVGWYHSHPGFGCWLSGVDISTQQSFEALSERAVAVVIGEWDTGISSPHPMGHEHEVTAIFLID